MFGILALVFFLCAIVLAIVGWRTAPLGWFAVAAIAAGLACWVVETGAGLIP
jgi:hypothetical protein